MTCINLDDSSPLCVPGECVWRFHVDVGGGETSLLLTPIHQGTTRPQLPQPQGPSRDTGLLDSSI